jgi:nucleoside phosphorylase
MAEALGADLVDMETAALAQAAERLGLPWIGIKATTDDANGDSAGDFTLNLAKAASRAARAAETIIGTL